MDPSQFAGHEAYLGEEEAEFGYYEEDEFGRRGRPRRRRRYRGRYPANVPVLQRGAYNRQQAMRASRQAQMAARQAQAAAAQGRDVVLVKDHIEVIVATSAAAGSVSQNKLMTDTLHLSHATFDGSSAGAAITSLVLHKATVLGPYSSTEALPASAFVATSQQKLSLTGNVIRNGQYVTLNGTIAVANDVLKLLLYGKREVQPGEC